ncbi:MAG: hypothetical protein B6I22_01745 [Desulfobacteraceae bacterium 4572_123]|nr:MAG: hypothetical protein B6I22_01745 [Desulfobacteraceae bacterium 4572_123]
MTEMRKIESARNLNAGDPPPVDVGRKQLINRLNYINFQNDTVLLRFKHKRFDHSICIPAKIKPCGSDRLDCIWADPRQPFTEYGAYDLECLMAPNGHKMFMARPTVKAINARGISLILPEACIEAGLRRVRRHSCSGISAYFTQNSALYYGTLVDFSALSMCIEVSTVPPQTFEWINPELPATLILFDGRETVYSGECKIIRQFGNKQKKSFILNSAASSIQRFQPKEFRSTRQQLVPLPDIIFTHPFTRKTVNLALFDLSGSGCSIEENEKDALLLPGMLIHDLELNLAGCHIAKTTAQVVYRNIINIDGNPPRIRCGIVFLDMDTQDHVKLTALLQKAGDKKSYICNRVDMDELWNFFFETGFIYPEKYEAVRKHREEIKKTYERLYLQTPSIARHFTYQDNHRILGHMSMIRYYKNTWLIHHHAARKNGYYHAGIAVLNQIGRFGNDAHRLYTLHMDYLICYYRPDNKFPNSVFGGAARNIKDPGGCSLDTFAYFHQSGNNPPLPIPDGWKLTPTQPAELTELEIFYKQVSGGLMLNALDLTMYGGTGCDELAEEFQRHGFQRQRRLYSLKKNNRLAAIIMLDISDVGLNLSDLTSCIKVIIIDSVDLSGNVLRSVLSDVSEQTGRGEMPVLLYPAAYAENNDITYQKLYTLWILSMQYTDPYFRYLKRLLKFIQH